MSARSLMVLGTGSHAGKSILTAALCRILANEGYRVAPFKAQNMSLNSAATPDGREIGRAQALQAEACRIAACAEMNPVLIKPSSDTGAQIVLLGRVWGQVNAWDYHTRRVEELFPTVLDSYQRLASQYDIIVLEGAGSPAEINLRERDIVNMRMARAAGAACLLVGDIDRGGVFASLLGTLELLEPWERALVRGYAINKFRGDVALLRPGLQMMEPRLGIPCAGVIPYLHDMGLDEEDGVAVEDRRRAWRSWRGLADSDSVERPLRIAVAALPHMSNFTDFDALAAEPSVALAYVERAEELAGADLVILPGSKQTLDDLDWLHRRGLMAALLGRHAAGAGIIGICGGFQMLGTRIEDPQGIESNGTACARDGLGLLPVHTVLHTEKITRPAAGTVRTRAIFGRPWEETSFRGYEIHVGETVYAEGALPFADITRAGSPAISPDGAVSADGRVFGTYVHGLFDDDRFRHAFVDAVRAARGLAPPRARAHVAAEREARLDRLAAHVRQSLDMDLIRGWLGLHTPASGAGVAL
ncbi:MAG: cobyric acid synthase [Acidobacteria bacterium]|nr:cobyric acid synthase [Acidobacteriota bacterium]